MTGAPRRSFKPLVVSAGALLLAALVSLAPAPGPAQATAGPGVSPRAASAGYQATKTLTRVFTNADGSTYSFPSHDVTVSADKTKDLRGRQRLRISWTGAQPSGGRASNPYGENGLQQEYPVMILQCRGTDDPRLPAAKQLSPQTCWTGSVAERSQVIRDEDQAAWIHDLDAAPADKERVSGVTPFPDEETCPAADTPPYYTRLTPFVAAKGTQFVACDSSHMPPEAAVGAAFPPNEIAAFTDTNGSGSVQFEVRSDVENESLGCNHTTACSIVVIPINGLSCDQPAEQPTISDKACRKGGRLPPGSSNFANEGVDQAVSPSLWWSASNWKNRFSIPITFGLPNDTCDILDPRAPTSFAGSELIAQAALQWSPAYCLNKKRFKFQLTQVPDSAAWSLMQGGSVPAAVVSSKHEDGVDPAGYAPTAATGFGIGYVIDRPENAGEYTKLKLNARLIAKLMTQSYLGSELGRQHPGLEDNPVGLMNDPEFKRLNPGLSEISQEAGAALLSLSTSSDLIQQLTEYMANDKDAMDFIHGEADEDGMVVNPSYQDVSVPTAQWPLLDTFVPKTNDECRTKNPSVYFSQLAAPVSSLRFIAQAILDGWPNVQTRCDYDASTQSYKLGRRDRQGYGSRFMLGVVSLGDAARYGLRTAALQTKPGTFVAPTDTSLAAALGLAHQEGKYEPFVLDQADIAAHPAAYPGTLVVYTAAKLRNLDKDEAAKIAKFIRISTTEGQRAGTGNGELPDGFVPIVDSGATKRYFDSAQAVAAAVEAQTPLPSDPSSSPTASTSPTPSGSASASVDPSTDTSGGGSSGGDVSPGDSGVPDLGSPSDGGIPAGSTPTAVVPPSTVVTSDGTVVTADTADVSSTWGARFLPSLLLLGLLGVAISGGVRFFTQPPRRP